MQPSFWDQLITELRLSLATRRSELAVLAVALLMGSVFVTTRLLETPLGTPSTAGNPTPTLAPLTSPVKQNTTPVVFQEGFGGLELSPLPTQPLILVTPSPSLTPTPTVPLPTLPPPGAQELTPTTTPTPTPRTNPWAPYIP